MNEIREVLVVDDLPEMVSLIQEHMEEEGYHVRVALTGEEALRVIQNDFVGVIILDLQLPDITGLEVFKAMIETAPLNPVIILSAFASFEQVAEAVRLGAYDFISKTDNVFELLGDTVKRAWSTLDLAPGFMNEQPDSKVFPSVIGKSEAIREVMERVNQVVDTRVTVLLEGESGTGKEVIARAIHRGSPRANGPFIAINCAGIPPSLLESELFGHERGAFTGAVARKIGKFEQGNGGTVFLDEVGEMDMALQAKLLRVLQEKEVVRIGGSDRIGLDVRIISATNRDLGKAIELMEFRADLFYRLAVFRIRLPPLRERMEDLPLLAEAIFSKFAEAEGISKPPTLARPALSLLSQFPFPGNVRELENILAYGAVMSRDGKVGIYDLPESVHNVVQEGRANRSGDGKSGGRSELPELSELIPTRNEVVSLDSFTQRYLRHVVQVCEGNISDASKRLGIARQTLYRRLPELSESD